MAETVIDTIHLGPATLGPGSLNIESAPPSEKRVVEDDEGPRPTPKPMIPAEVKMTEAMEDRLIRYLDNELLQCELERGEQIRKFARLKAKYRTKFPEFPKDWPMANSSQITIPVIKTAVNSIGPRLFQTIMAADPLASIRTEDPMFQDQVFDYEEFLNLYSTERLDMESVIDTWITELVKLGTSVIEVTSYTDRRSILVYDVDSGEYQKETITKFDGPKWFNVPIEDWWMRPAYQEIEAAPWCGKAIRLSWSQIKDMAFSGELNHKDIDKIWMPNGDPESTSFPPDPVKMQETLEGLKPQDRDQFTLFELSVRWDVDNDGLDEELLVYYHRESRTLLRRRANGFAGAERPWIVGRFIPIEYWFYGEGMAEILEHLQEEISTIHNQRIDNATIANLRIILVKALIQGLRPGDRLWSGKVVRVPNSVKEDVGTLQLGDVYPSTVSNETIALQYVDRVGGAGDVATGQAQPVTRTTAAAQLALLEELNRRFDKTLRGLRRALRKGYNKTTGLFIQQGIGNLGELWLGEKRGMRLQQFLSNPHDYLAQKMKLQIHATKSTINPGVDFQTQVGVFQLLQQLWQTVVQTAQIAGGEQLIPVLAHEFIAAVRPVLKRIFQYADAPDPDAAVSILTVLENILPAPEDLGGMDAARQAEAQAILAKQRGGLGEAGVNGNGNSSGETNDRVGRLESIIGSSGSADRGV